MTARKTELHPPRRHRVRLGRRSECIVIAISADHCGVPPVGFGFLFAYVKGCLSAA